MGCCGHWSRAIAEELCVSESVRCIASTLVYHFPASRAQHNTARYCAAKWKCSASRILHVSFFNFLF